jgi:hypothetical protein
MAMSGTPRRPPVTDAAWSWQAWRAKTADRPPPTPPVPVAANGPGGGKGAVRGNARGDRGDAGDQRARRRPRDGPGRVPAVAVRAGRAAVPGPGDLRGGGAARPGFTRVAFPCGRGRSG